MLEIDQNDILMLIANYFNRIGEDKLATKVSSKIVNSDQSSDSPLLKKKLEKIVRHYVTAHQKLLHYYIEKAEKNTRLEEQDDQQIQQVKETNKLNGNKRKRQQSQEEDNQIVDHIDKKRKRSNAIEDSENKNIGINKVQNQKQKLRKQIFKGFTSPKLLQTTVVDKVEVVEFNDEQPEQKKNKHKKIIQENQENNIEQQSEIIVQKKKKKKNKSKIIVQQEEQVADEIEKQQEQVQQQIIVTKKKDKKKSKKKQQLKQQVAQAQEQVEIKKQKVQEKQEQIKKIESTKVVKQKNDKVEDVQTKIHQPFFFSRVKREEIGELPQELRDNSFNAKFKFGGGDEWGMYGYEKLKNVRGDGFKKQKGKLKNKAFQASGIDINRINSIKL